jgi:hypothetical protein
LARKRKPERVSHGGTDVLQNLPRPGRPEHNSAVGKVDDGDARSGEERYSRHVGTVRPPA